MNMSYLKNKPIAVLSDGAAGREIADACAAEGAAVRLWEFSADEIAGGARTENGAFEDVPRELIGAVRGAILVIVAAAAPSHEPLFRGLIPLLEDGQILHIFPDHYGSLLLRRMMQEMKCETTVLVGGWSLAANDLDSAAGTGRRELVLQGAALPFRDTRWFLESANYIPPLRGIHSGGDTVLGVNLSDMAPAISAPELADEFRAEKAAIAEALHVQVRHLGGMPPLSDCEMRRLAADAAVDCSVSWQLAEKFGVAAPALRAMLDSGPAKAVQPGLPGGSRYTLNDLGIGCMTVDQLQKYLRQGPSRVS